MSEPAKKNLAALPPVAGGKTPAQNPPAVSPAAKPAAPAPAPIPPAKNSSAPLFGGHKGGGKKRLDGLVAGSPEAVEADRKKDAERKRLARAEKRNSETPPPLPPASSPAARPAGEKFVFDSPQSLPVDFPQAAPAAAPGNFPTFVPWLQSKLQKPAALLTKIIARARDFARTKQVKKLKLTAAREKMILDKCKIREEILTDFSQSLAECATIELNKRQVPGAEHGHYITLAISAGELIYSEIETTRLIESLVLEDHAEKQMLEARANQSKAGSK
jgi:hypothetical protein